MTLDKNKLYEVESKYKEEMYQVRKSIKNYSKYLEEYKEYIDIIDDVDDARREKMLNFMFLLSQNLINQDEFIEKCPEFISCKDKNIREVIKNILSSYWNINLERKMYCIKLYIILDECLTLIIKDISDKTVVCGGVMPKLKKIEDLLSINIDSQKKLELNVFSCIRNDIIHNQSVFSQRSIDDLLNYQSKDAQYIEQLFGLKKDNIIKINMKKILGFVNISREIFDEIYRTLEKQV